MTKKGGAVSRLLSFVAWLTGVIVSLAVGFAMAGRILTLPTYLGGATIAVIAGWIVIVTTLLGVLLAIVKHVG